MIEQLLNSDNPRVPLFRLAFRPFFLFGALFGLLAILLWGLTLNGEISLSLYGGPVFWHIHEMLFGFTGAIIVGFLLTAVQNWTGFKSVNGLALFLLFSVWLLARISFLFDSLLPEILLAALDVSFMLFAALFLSIPLIRAKQTRNLFFLPILILFAVCNGMMHLGLLNQDHNLVLQGTRTSLFLVALLMVVIGGRVIPMFTANGTKTMRVANISLLDKAALSLVWLVMLLHLTGASFVIPPAALGSLLMMAGILHFVRCLRWRFWITTKVALLWPLHLAYMCLCLAFFLLGFDLITTGEMASTSWHMLTVGGIGLLILAMISRVSLGHTGRPLIAPKWMLPAFVLMALSGITRSLLPLYSSEFYLSAINLSVVLWLLAYGTFVASYSILLCRPRIDNKPG